MFCIVCTLFVCTKNIHFKFQAVFSLNFVQVLYSLYTKYLQIWCFVQILYSFCTNFLVRQELIQALLLMFLFEQRLSFWMFCFMKNDHKIIVKWRWGAGGDVSSAAGWWWSPDGGSGGKAHKKFWLFNFWRANK